MIIEIPFKTPTINHLYWHRGNMKIMKKEAKELQQKIIDIVKAQPKEDFEGKELWVKVKIYESWYYQNGEIARKDVSNREKFLTDSVFKGLELDDKHIFELGYEKCESNEEKAIIMIGVLSLLNQVPHY